MKRPAAAAPPSMAGAPRASAASTSMRAAAAAALPPPPPSAQKRRSTPSSCEPSPANPPSKRGRGRPAAVSRDSSPDLAPARHVLSTLLNKAGLNASAGSGPSSSHASNGGALGLGDPNLERQLATAQQKLQEAEKEVVKLKERASQQESRAERAEKVLAEQTEQLRQVHVKVAAAEAKAQHLAEQANAATDAVERAARAEERAAVMGDLQNKLPLLIRAVIGSVAYPYQQGPYASPGPIKLEFESIPVVANMEPPSAVPHSKTDSSTTRATAPGTAAAAGAGGGGVQSVDGEHEEENGTQKKGLMQRAMGALSNRRKLQD